MHTAPELSLFYKDTGALPADDRFNANEITVPQVKQLYQYMLDGAPYLENFIPTDLDAEGQLRRSAADVCRQDDAAAGGPDDEVDMARIRTIDPDLIDNFKIWANSSSATSGRPRARGRPYAAAPAALRGSRFCGSHPRCRRDRLFVYGYSIYRVLEEATHRDGESVGLGNLKIALNDPFFRMRSATTCACC